MSHQYTSAIIFVIGTVMLAPFAIVSWRMVTMSDALREESKARVGAAFLEANKDESFELNSDGTTTKFSSVVSSTMLPLSIRSHVVSSLYVRRSMGIMGLLCVIGLVVCLAFSCFVPTKDINGGLTTIRSENRVIWFENGKAIDPEIESAPSAD